MNKRITVALRESEDRYRALFEISRDGVALVDVKNGRIIDCNPAYEAITGISKEKLLTMKVWETSPVEQRGKRKQIFQKVLKNGIGGSAELEYHRPDGKIIPSEFVSRTVTIGSKTYILSIVRDISELKRWEESRKSSEEKYRAIFAEAKDGIVLIDSHQDPGTIVDCNPEFERQTGRSLAELKKMKIWQIRPKEKVDASLKKFFQTQGTGVGQASDLDFETPDGRIINIEFASKRVVIEGHYYQQSTCRDITQRKLIEAKLEEYRSKLERMVKERTVKLKETIARLELMITEYKLAETKLILDEKRIWELTKAYMEAQEVERQRISLELHDQTIQDLIGLKLQLGELKDNSTSSQQKKSIELLMRSVDKISRETRNTMKNLYPATLAKYGLVKIVKGELLDLEEQTKCKTSLTTNLTSRLERNVEAALYRICHEAILNIKKHCGNCPNVQVSIESINDSVEMRIKDDGPGFDVEKAQISKTVGGIVSMKRRTELIDGVFEITSIIGNGTDLLVRIPIITLLQ